MRKKTIEVQIGKVKIGGKNPVAIQSMTNTDTADVAATVGQIIRLCDAGSELVRVTVNNPQAARAVPLIKERLLKKGYKQPIIGDFHYNGHILLTRHPDCAAALDKYRINPGNVGGGSIVCADNTRGGESAHEYNFRTMIECAIKYKKPVRIGVNWGSLDQRLFKTLMEKNARLKSGRRKNIPRSAASRNSAPESDREILYEAMVQSALQSAKVAEKIGLPKNKIVLSVKMSDVQDVIAAYEMLSKRCDYPLHLGLTEAGMGDKGLIASSAALAILLQKGIGDTIRFSLTPGPGQPREKEVVACQILLQTMGIRNFRPMVTSCPGCGRTSNNLHQEIAAEVNDHISKKMHLWCRKHPGARFNRLASLKIAVMGCVVNGPGEASHADIAICLPGKAEKPVAQVYIKGKPYKVLKGKNIAREFIAILDAKIDGLI